MASNEVEIDNEFNRYDNGRQYLPLTCPLEQLPKKTLAENLAEYRNLCYKVAYEELRTQGYIEEEISDYIFEAAPAPSDPAPVIESSLRRLAQALDEDEVPIDLAAFWRLADSLSTEIYHAGFIWIRPLKAISGDLKECREGGLRDNLQFHFSSGKCGIKVGKMFEIGDDGVGNWLFVVQLSVDQEGETITEWKICYYVVGCSPALFDSVNQLIERQIEGLRRTKEYQHIWALEFPPMEDVIKLESAKSATEAEN
ncbi:hypothetical protein ABW21_db0206397 [Orbilia brochopaga]|nr:hypothetical protein ABW21_db0206397 [Drechslerella brochopaga]